MDKEEKDTGEESDKLVKSGDKKAPVSFDDILVDLGDSEIANLWKMGPSG